MVVCTVCPCLDTFLVVVGGVFFVHCQPPFLIPSLTLSLSFLSPYSSLSFPLTVCLSGPSLSRVRDFEHQWNGTSPSHFMFSVSVVVSVILSVTVDIFLVVSGCLSIYYTVSVSQSFVETSNDEFF